LTDLAAGGNVHARFERQDARALAVPGLLRAAAWSSHFPVRRSAHMSSIPTTQAPPGLFLIRER